MIVQGGKRSFNIVEVCITAIIEAWKICEFVMQQAFTCTIHAKQRAV